MKLGQAWSLRFDLKRHHVTGLGKEGLRFEKGGDMLKDAQGHGLEGKYLVDRADDGTWQLADVADIETRPATGELSDRYGVWTAGAIKRTFARSIDAKDVTPLSKVFPRAMVVDTLSRCGGLIVHSALSAVEQATIVPYTSKDSDACLLADGHVSTIRSQSFYEHDDMGQVAIDNIIARDQRSFRA